MPKVSLFSFLLSFIFFSFMIPIFSHVSADHPTCKDGAGKDISSLRITTNPSPIPSNSSSFDIVISGLTDGYNYRLRIAQFRPGDHKYYPENGVVASGAKASFTVKDSNDVNNGDHY